MPIKPDFSFYRPKVSGPHVILSKKRSGTFAALLNFLGVKVFQEWIEDFVDEDTGEVVSVTRTSKTDLYRDIEEQVIIKFDYPPTRQFLAQVSELQIDEFKFRVVIYTYNGHSLAIDLLDNTYIIPNFYYKSKRGIILELFKQIITANDKD